MIVEVKKVLKLMIWSGCCSLGLANAYPADFSKLQNLSDPGLNYYAEQLRKRDVLVNGETVKNSLSDMNLKQVSYNLSSIENMQTMSGSGISFKQWRNTSINAVNKENTITGDSYQNVLSGKFSVDGETSWVASINEGQTQLEEIRVFTGDFAESKTQSYGLSLAYNKKLGNSNFFAYVGKNWIENKLETLAATYDGEQTHLGFGANYKTIFEDINFTPQVNVQRIQSSLNSSGFEEGGNAKQTTATISMKSDYKVTEKVGFAASIDYEKDLSAKGTIKTIDGYQKVDTMLPKERIGVALTMMYKPVDKVSVMVNFKHSSSNTWKNESVNVGLNYNF